MIVTLIVGALAVVSLAYAFLLLRTAYAWGQLGVRGEGLIVGAVTNFFDTLGIGSFAPTIAWFRLRKLVPDRLIPMTMLAGFILPALLQGLVFMILLGVRVDPLLILACVVAMVVGGYFSVPLAARAPIHLIQGIVGSALLLAAFFYSLSNLGLMPGGGVATSLPPVFFAVAVALHLLLGVLLAFGVGNYAPTLAVLSIMGLDPRLAFPIMATAAGMAGATAAARSLHLVKLDLRMALGLAIGAIPAVLIAAFIVKEMPLTTLRWLVVVVVTYAGLTLLISAARRDRETKEAAIAEAL
ncbi:MAG: hypothetical protein ABIS23_00840 [Sphingomicrobium sp.]